MKIDGPSPSYAFLAGGGKMGELIAAFDWSTTSLGPIADWSIPLRTSVSIALRSPVAIVMLWGEDGVMLYNDAYSVFAAGRHPRLLGSKVREGWPEVADFNDNIMRVVLAGRTLSYRDQKLVLYRHGSAETLYADLDYSPILDEAGSPVAVIAIVTETTEKVVAKAWLDGERERMRQMFEQAPGFMAMLSGPDHVFDLTNAAYMQLIGHRNVIGRPVREALPDIEGQGFYELLDRVFGTGEAFVGHGVPASLQRTPGAAMEERFVDLIYQPVRDPAGVVVGIFVQGADITERVVAERIMREREAQFRLFAEAMPNHVWTSRADGLLDWFNSRVYEYSGAAEGELDAGAWASIVHPDDVDMTAASWGLSIGSGKPYETEFRLRRADGDYRWHIARAVPIRADDGSITRWIGTNTDIDDQKRTQGALAESEERLKRAIDELGASERRFRLSQNAAGIASLEVDIPTGQVVGSDGFWSLWGLDPRDSIHISALESIVLPEDGAVRSTEETRQGGTANPDVEYRIRRPDTGEIRWLARNIEFTYDAEGRPLKMFGIMQDVTERREAQSRQEMLTHELEHRIKNILAMVSAIASQTLRNTDLETGREAFNERLKALAGAHDLLTKTRWTTASLAEVVAAAVAPFPTANISIDGPQLALTPKMALALALAVNELGTNSLKYGALSADTGSVRINWTTAEGELVWRWHEAGGPPVVAPTRRGFGTFLVQRVLAADFGGQVRIEYAAGGVECTLNAPITNYQRQPTQ